MCMVRIGHVFEKKKISVDIISAIIKNRCFFVVY